MCLNLKGSYFRDLKEVEEFIAYNNLNLFKDEEKIKKYAYNKKYLQQWRQIKELGI